MKNGLIRKLMAGVLALLLGLAMAGVAQGAGKTLAKDGRLGKLHAAEEVGCVKCHGKGSQTAPVPQERCLKCHEGDSSELAAKTANVKPLNPHENRHYGTEADCGLCHRQHAPSVNFCLDCHPRFDFKVK